MRIHTVKHISKYLHRIALVLACALVLLSALPCIKLAATETNARALLAHCFPYRESNPLQSALKSLSNLTLGFDPTAPQSILKNQLAFLPLQFHAQPAPKTQPTQKPQTVIQPQPIPENALPILETSQTIGPLKNTEGANKEIYIDNDTSYTVNIPSLMEAPLQLSMNADAPTVLIVHTHTTESYTPEGQAYYSPNDSTRTQDKTQNVVRVGEEIASTLNAKGISVLHDTTINDYPSYNGSYTKTLGIIEWYLERYPSIQMVIDVHRDGMMKSDGTKLKVTADVNGEKAAQVMLVIGTNEGGLTHNNWRENLKLGLHIQDKLTTLYPGLARPLNLRKERFNQHTTPGSMIVEVGSDGNTLSEAIVAGRLFATALAEIILMQE